MYLDLDHFKLVNDGLGHSVGDGLLSEVAARLQGSIRASDTISRLGGDEFTILLNDTSSTDAIFGIARKILTSLAKPFHVNGHELFMTASIGISLFPADGEDVEALLKSADSAMYRAKELGRNQAQLFTASMNERYVRRLAVAGCTGLVPRGTQAADHRVVVEGLRVRLAVEQLPDRRLQVLRAQAKHRGDPLVYR